jgi:lysophospholipase L1-like esterase
LVRATIRQGAAIVRSRAAGRGLGHAVPLPAVATPGHGPRVLVAGDSTALDWGASRPDNGLVGRLLRDFPDASVDRVARTGARLREVARQLRTAGDALQAGSRYDLVLVLAGGNDALRIGHGAGLQRDSLAVAEAMKPLSAHRVWLGPADVSLSPLFVAPFDRWLSRRMQAVVDAIGVASRSRGVRFIDFFAPQADDVFSQEPRRYYAADLVHPADDAYAYCYDVVRATLPLERWLGSARGAA